MKNEEHYLSVSQLNSLIKDKFDQDPELSNVYLRGELSNFKIYSSGHAYFSLKDNQAVISGLMWGSYVMYLPFEPKDGDEVLVHGKVSVYPPSGKYQIYCDHMELFGQGSELLKLKELAKKLQAEGLFDESRKRKLPTFPRTIGLITAKGSAAIKDMVVNIQKRWPLVDIIVFPSLVQGKDAPKNLIEAFRKAESYPLDTLIIGRGGGSSEDLGAFNDEGLVRALATSKCPTISAVGHEIDTTLTDYVCDVRVSTPTAAAVAAVPDQNLFLENLDATEASLTATLKSQYQTILERFNALKKRGFFANPALIYQQKISDLELLKQRFLGDIDASMKERSQDVASLKDHLNALSPYGVLGRGYAITTDSRGRILNSVDAVEAGDTIKTQLKDGIIEAKVASKEKKNG